MKSQAAIAGVFILACVSGCASQFDHFARPPTITAPGASKIPMPAPSESRMQIGSTQQPTIERTATAGSLWRSGPESLFGDRRARELGDILTVMVEIDEEAEIRNRTDRSRSGSEDLSVPALFGVQSLATQILPNGAGINPAIEASSNSTTSGDGRVQREEKITLRVAATVTHILPNGHLAISGSQEIRVNYELRELLVAGIVRPEDISRNNVITYDKIADARISYGGRGQISDVQRARYGSQIIDLVSPF